MIKFQVPVEELKKALTEYEIARERGFIGSIPVFYVTKAGRCISDTEAKFEDLIVCGEPNNPSQNWGRYDFYKYTRCVNGELIDDQDDI